MKVHTKNKQKPPTFLCYSIALQLAPSIEVGRKSACFCSRAAQQHPISSWVCRWLGVEGAQPSLLEHSQQKHLAALPKGPVDPETLLSDRHISYQPMKEAVGSSRRVCLFFFFHKSPSFFHKAGAQDAFCQVWGLRKSIPRGRSFSHCLLLLPILLLFH